MSFKHAKAVTVKTANGQAEMKGRSLIHLNIFLWSIFLMFDWVQAIKKTMFWKFSDIGFL